MAAPGLSVPLTSFVGRERVLEEVAGLLASTRLLTLTGVGGVGKTRLALAVASRQWSEFADGVSFVPLAAIRDPDLVVLAVAQAFGLPDTGGRPPAERLAEMLRERQHLLVLDNFEQVVSAAPAVGTLLLSCPRLKILVTSRERLRLAGEQVYQVPPFALPASPESTLVGADVPATWRTSEAVRLFVERARGVRPSFMLTPDNAPAVAEVCRRLDGVPLAIELAAARVGVLPPRVLLKHLEPRLPLLTGGPRDAPTRQRTLRDTLAWSQDLLSEPERRLFRRLSVFVGGCTLDAVSAVCGPLGDAEIDVLTLIASLVDKSLLRSDDAADGPRFSMLETVREYASEQLETCGEARDIRRRHTAYYLALAERARPEQHGPAAAAWFDRLEAEHGNLRAALDWCEADAIDEPARDGAAGTGGIDVATRIVEAVAWFWMVRGHLREGRERQGRLLARTPDGTPARARALLVSSVMARFGGDYAQALAFGREGLALWEVVGGRYDVAVAHARLGDAHGLRGEYDQARHHLEQAADIFRALGRESGLEHPVMLTLAQAAWVAEDMEYAEQLYEQSVTAGRAAGDAHSVQVSLRYLGLLAYRRGDPARAMQLQREVLRLVLELGDRTCMMSGLAGFAIAAASLGSPAQVARLLAAVDRQHTLTGAALMPFLRAEYDHHAAAVRTALGEQAFAAAWAGGRALSLGEAVAEALATEPSPGRDGAPAISKAPPSRPVETPARLTAREVEVLRLIAAGRTSKEIAAELVVTVPTVERHITHIYGKIGARGRADATAYALKHGLE